MLTRGDLRALELLAGTLATETELVELLRREGLTLQTAAGGSKSHPASKLLESTRAQAARLLSSFGMTPQSRLSFDLKLRAKPHDGAFDFS